MVQFELALREQELPEWSEYYLDYSGLKLALVELKLAYEREARGESDKDWTPLMHNNSFAGRHVSSEMNSKEDVFSRRVDDEVEKVVLFFLQQQGDLARRLSNLKQKLPKFEPIASRGKKAELMGDLQGGEEEGTPLWTGQAGGKTPLQKFEVDEAYRELLGVGQDLVKLLRYLRLNVSGLRKILKKHDKQIRDRLLATNYLSSRARVRYSFLQQLYHNEGILALVGTMSGILESLGADIDDMRIAASSDDDSNKENALMGQINDALYGLSAEQNRTVSDYLTLGSDLMLEVTPIDEMTDAEVEAMKKRKLDPWSAYINLVSTFLYMANYYIVGPTSTDYAEALGGNPALSGVIIGMTPIAACVSCVVYSYWTNSSFKYPLLLCSALLIIGNALYGLALSYDAFWMVLVGRLFIGFGGARGVNRRYIADTVPIENRTFFSAAFVAVGAVGMAFGPICSAWLTYLDFDIGIVKVNGLTGPGWFMFVLWLIMGILTIFKFKEPTHRYFPDTSSKPTYNSDDSNLHTPTVVSSKKKAVLNSKAAPYGSTGMPKTRKPSTGLLEEGNLIKDSSESTLLLEKSSWTVSSPDKSNSDLLGKRNRKNGVGTSFVGLPLPLCFALYSYFINKLITEAAVNSAPLLTWYFFNWDVSQVGTLMAALGIVTLPISIGVGKLSLIMEDRFLMQCICSFAALGCLIVITLPNEWVNADYGVIQYIVGMSLIFVALQAHEGIIMSITSKIIPPNLARGTFNSGFLATEAGTGARFFGDIAITLIGVNTVNQLLNFLFIPGFFMIVSLLLGTWWCYPWLDV